MLKYYIFSISASDVHVGYNEKDPIRGKDSFVTLKEIFQIAKEKYFYIFLKKLLKKVLKTFLVKK